mmetsp:Transcript_26073/g.42614  ORF Transcript_26073/g.42614 Transcript_26073/m.42614 type:complete len:381 (-) Transcript_26073:49-1191(-)
MTYSFARTVPRHHRTPDSKAYWNELMKLGSFKCMQFPFKLMDNILHHRSIEEITIDHAPMFIIGHWRSGTTYLHNIISKHPQMIYPTLHTTLNEDCYISGDSFLYNMLKPQLSHTRGFDNVAQGLLDPIEEEVALERFGPFSYYSTISFPSLHDEYKKYLTMQPPQVATAEIEDWKRYYWRMVQKLLYYNQIGEHRKLEGNGLSPMLVLKSPPNTARIPLLLDMFPTAKFVFIHRNPLHVIPSSMTLRKYMRAKQNVGRDLPEQQWLELALDKYLVLMKKYISDVDEHKVFANKPKQWIEIGYDELYSDPLQTIEKIGCELDMESLMCDEIRSFVANETKSHEKTTHSKLTEEQQGIVLKELEFAFHRWQYASTPMQNIL